MGAVAPHTAAEPFAIHPELITPVLRINHRAINSHLIKQAGIERQHAANGAVTFIQRFRSAANLNTHLHALVLDGVYGTAGEGAPLFHPTAARGNDQLQTLLDKIIKRIIKLLTRLNHVIEEDGIVYLTRTDHSAPDNIRAPLQAASSTWRIAQGARAGRKVHTLIETVLIVLKERGYPFDEAQDRQRDAHRDALCANTMGFSLYARVRCEANDRQGVEQLEIIGADTISPSILNPTIEAGIHWGLCKGAKKAIKFPIPRKAVGRDVVQQIFLVARCSVERVHALVDLDPAAAKDILRNQRRALPKAVQNLPTNNKDRDAAIIVTVRVGTFPGRE